MNVHGPDTHPSVRDSGCPCTDLSDFNEEELDREGLDAAVNMHQFVSGCYCSCVDVNDNVQSSV